MNISVHIDERNLKVSIHGGGWSFIDGRPRGPMGFLDDLIMGVLYNYLTSIIVFRHE